MRAAAMFDDRPVDFGIFVFAIVWSVFMVPITCMIAFGAARRKSASIRLLYSLGALCVLIVVITFGFSFGLEAWYGGTPDRGAGTAYQHYVRLRSRLTPVTELEMQRLERVEHYSRWIAVPIMMAAACFVSGALVQRRTKRTA